MEGAFQAAAKGRVNALVTINIPVLNRQQKQIADLAIKNRLPSMYEASDWVEAGGLMSYSANDAENFRRVAYYVDRILKGAKPADLPVEQPTKFELVINLKTAKQIGQAVSRQNYPSVSNSPRINKPRRGSTGAAATVVQSLFPSLGLPVSPPF